MNRKLSDIKSILTSYEKRRFTTLIFLNTLISIADIGSIALVFIVLNIYGGKTVLWAIPFLQHLNINRQSLIPAFVLIIIFVLKSLAGYFIIKAQAKYISDISSRLAGKNLLLYLEGSYEDHVNLDSSVWIRKISFQSQEFAQYILSGIQQIINESILIFITITALALYNIKLLLIVSLVLLPAIIILLYITKKRLKNTRENIKSANELSLQYLTETISGFVESNIYNKNEIFTSRYIKTQFTLNRFISDMQVTQAMPVRFFETFAVLGLFIFIAVMQISSDGSSAGILLLGAFIAAAYKIIPGISKIINYASQIKTYRFTIDELGKKKNNTNEKGFLKEEKIQDIELRNVYFSYNDNDVLKDFNCLIKENSFTGICGQSGKGKTTLIELMLGFLSPQSGNILFNNLKINSVEIKNYWQQFAYVKQSTFLLHDSILQNIILYETNPDEKKLNTILKITGLTYWVNELKDGVNTIITENGKNISGGQRQRIAIARALFKNTSIIILDEPFNELDEDSEISLLQYFKQLAKEGKTIILITHNLNSFSFCDNIIYLNESTE